MMAGANASAGSPVHVRFGDRARAGDQSWRVGSSHLPIGDILRLWAGVKAAVVQFGGEVSLTGWALIVGVGLPPEHLPSDRTPPHPQLDRPATTIRVLRADRLLSTELSRELEPLSPLRTYRSSGRSRPRLDERIAFCALEK